MPDDGLRHLLLNTVVASELVTRRRRAGSVVTRDTELDGVYVGTPAVRVRDLDPND